MKKIYLIFLCLFSASVTMVAEKTIVYQGDESVITTDVENEITDKAIRNGEMEKFPLWDNWYLQFGGDMTLQNPYGYDFKNVLKEGYSFGVNVAVGKTFTPEISLRAKVNWENGIIDSKANWLAPFDEPGVNHSKGGYVSVVGDILLNLHNIICGYDESRRWNISVFPRAGVVYNFGVAKGSPLIGMGISNTYKLNDKWGLYADVAYNGVSSGFNGIGTDVGGGSNMYFDISVGATYSLNSHKKHGEGEKSTYTKSYGLWEKWFVQLGGDMTLYTPYGKNLGKVFTKGRAMGLDVAIGKWLSPSIGLRGKLNLENILIENKDFEWVGYDEKQYTSNFDGKGNVMLQMDVLLSTKHIFMGGTYNDKWDMYAFGRMGLGKNRAVDSLSPTVGVGLGGSYRFDSRWGIYADTGFSGITSEFFSSDSTTGMSVPTGFNGIWDFNIGVQYTISVKR